MYTDKGWQAIKDFLELMVTKHHSYRKLYEYHIDILKAHQEVFKLDPSRFELVKNQDFWIELKNEFNALNMEAIPKYVATGVFDDTPDKRMKCFMILMIGKHIIPQTAEYIETIN